MINQQRSDHTISPWFQAFFIGCTSLALAVMLYYNIQFFDAREPLPQLLPATSELYKNISPAPVRAGIYIRDLPEFDMLHGKLTTDLVLWFKYKPSQVSPEQLANFVFERAEIKSQSKPIVTSIGPDEALATFELRLGFVMPLNFKDFPLDDHQLSLTIANYTADASAINLITDDSDIIINPEIQTEGWFLFKKTATAGYTQDPISSKKGGTKTLHPRAIFSLDFERSGIRQVTTVFLPLLLIFLITLFSFSVEPQGSDFYNVIAMSTTSILALIAYRFVIETISPATGYFTLSDYMFIFFLLATTAILFINALGDRVSRDQKKLITVALHAATIAFFVYLFVW